jgi:hypothetical protein
MIFNKSFIIGYIPALEIVISKISKRNLYTFAMNSIGHRSKKLKAGG